MSLRVVNNVFDNVVIKMVTRFSNYIPNKSFHFIENKIKNSNFDFTIKFDNIFFKSNLASDSVFDFSFLEFKNAENNLVFMYNNFETSTFQIFMRHKNSLIYFKNNRFINLISYYGPMILIEQKEIFKKKNLNNSIEIHGNIVKNSHYDVIFRIKSNAGDSMNLTIMNNTFSKNILRYESIFINGFMKPKIAFNVFDNIPSGERLSDKFEIYFGPLLSFFQTNAKLPVLDISYNYFNTFYPYEKIYDGHKDGMSPKVQLSPIFIDENLSELRNVSAPKVNFTNFQGRFDKDMEFYGIINIIEKVLINGNVLIKDPNCRINIGPKGELTINGNLQILGSKHKTTILSSNYKKARKINILNGFVKMKNVELAHVTIAFYWNSKIEIESCHFNVSHLCLFFFQINQNVVKINKSVFYSKEYSWRHAMEFIQSYNILINNTLAIRQSSLFRISNTDYFNQYLSRHFPSSQILNKIDIPERKFGSFLYIF